MCFSSIGFAVYCNKIGSISYLNMSSNTCTNGFKQDISRTFFCWEHKNTSNIIMCAVGSINAYAVSEARKHPWGVDRY